MKTFLATALLVTAGLLAACATGPTPQQQSAIVVATDLATGYAIENGLTDSQAKVARALRFETIAKEIQNINNAGPLTLPTLASDLQPLIATLPPADQLAAHTLLAALKPYVDQQLQNPKIANSQSTIGIFLQAVIDSCSVYTGS